MAIKKSKICRALCAMLALLVCVSFFTTKVQAAGNFYGYEGLEPSSHGWRVTLDQSMYGMDDLDFSVSGSNATVTCYPQIKYYNIANSDVYVDIKVVYIWEHSTNNGSHWGILPSGTVTRTYTVSSTGTNRNVSNSYTIGSISDHRNEMYRCTINIYVDGAYDMVQAAYAATLNRNVEKDGAAQWRDAVKYGSISTQMYNLMSVNGSKSMTPPTNTLSGMFLASVAGTSEAFERYIGGYSGMDGGKRLYGFNRSPSSYQHIARAGIRFMMGREPNSSSELNSQADELKRLVESSTSSRFAVNSLNYGVVTLDYPNGITLWANQLASQPEANTYMTKRYPGRSGDFRPGTYTCAIKFQSQQRLPSPQISATIYASTSDSSWNKVAFTSSVSAYFDGSSMTPSKQWKKSNWTTSWYDVSASATRDYYDYYMTSSIGSNNFMLRATVAGVAADSNQISAFQVYFSPNGGSLGSVPNIMAKIGGTGRYLPTARPSRSGYTFQGWSTSPSGSVSYSPGSYYTEDGSKTLYAIWSSGGGTTPTPTPPPSTRYYTLTYNANGGSGAPGSTSMQAGVIGYISQVTPSRSNYTFLGWSKSSSASTATYNYYLGSRGGNPDDSITLYSDVTLYAVWQYGGGTTPTPPPSSQYYYVYYNANGGVGAPGNGSAQSGTTYCISPTEPTRSGYTFKGWSESSYASSPTYNWSQGTSSGPLYDRFTITRNMYLYAVWDDDGGGSTPSSLSVTYHDNGGSGGPGTEYGTYGEVYFISATEPSRSGYEFVGWSTSSYASSAQYNYYAYGSYTGPMTDRLTLTSSMDLYAVWKLNTYVVYFNANGGNGSMSSQTFTRDQYQYLRSNSFTRTGYTFKGWATYSSGGVTYTNRQYVSNLTTGSSITLYAVWQANKYTVHFEGNHNTGGSTADQQFTYDVYQNLRANGFTKTGYTFQGWSLTSTGGVQYTNRQSVKNLASSGTITLYAVWKPNTYRIEFHGNGNTGGNMPSQLLTYDTPAKLRSNTFGKTDEIFQGWSVTPGGVVKYVNEQEVKNLTAVDGAVIDLYAVWQKRVQLQASLTNVTVNSAYNGTNYFKVAEQGEISFATFGNVSSLYIQYGTNLTTIQGSTVGTDEYVDGNLESADYTDRLSGNSSDTSREGTVSFHIPVSTLSIDEFTSDFEADGELLCTVSVTATFTDGSSATQNLDLHIVSDKVNEKDLFHTALR